MAVQFYQPHHVCILRHSKHSDGSVTSGRSSTVLPALMSPSNDEANLFLLVAVASVAVALSSENNPTVLGALWVGLVKN